ncbi:MAG: thioredoxin domain-containing protein [Bradyrhizobiaceae bacterium]|nr:thioredoxin domain-containing protein [Hyphomicrobiales bacterium]MBV9429421.1 thioredoxin domain-containing protein [Bradyrhizobiaceae bacterium]
MSAPTTSDQTLHRNRLAGETSPYLLQHQHNPVAWWPWGPDALAEATRTGKPILLSVGYAACHWCHVMAHESFEDEGVAAVMNELFVNIKVDREERPDIDQIYMSALHLIGEQGGWPLTMFLTPAGEPVWGGTYFPKTSRYGRPAFTDVLREIARVFREEPDRIDQARQSLIGRLSERARPQGKVVIGRAELDSIAGRFARLIDRTHGGLQGAPKFPQCSVLELLWRAGLRTGETAMFDPVELTLDRICQGGIYDHLGGGFSRYSVDERWLVPHFEKMLYDNAQLLELLALAHARTGHPLFRTRAHETVAWLAREMTTRQGAFCASLDADSEGEEGKFYVWSYDEIIRLLGIEDGTFFAEAYDATPEGNFEGHSILNRINDLPRSMGRSKEQEQRLAGLREKLLAARGQRVRPGLDDKVLADWNGLMIAALANAGALLGEPGWVAMAERAFAFIAGEMTRGDRLGHSWREGRLLFPGLASDFAAMIKAALALNEATGERGYLERALVWQRALDRHYGSAETGGYFLTADDAEGLVVRPHSTLDDAIPNPNAIAAQNLVRLALLGGDDAWREAADRLFDGILPSAAENLFGHASLLNALDLRLRAAEIVIVGSETEPLVHAALALPFLDRIVLRAPSAEALPAAHPAHAKIAAAPTGGAAFVCVGETCSLPVTGAEEVAKAIRTMRSA